MEQADKKHFDRNVWLRKALDVLFSHGISHVKVEILARELKVTKGSFYWHFKNREELLHSMVDWWRQNQLSFIKNIDSQNLDDAQGLIKAVINFTHHTDDSSHDVAMREFARFDAYAAEAVGEVDQQRLDYLTKLFRAANFDSAEASLRARALYFYQVGEYTTSLQLDPAVRDDLAERRFKLLVCRPLDENS
ncbi:MAG: TetR/AcrR family transcriptional regulator [Pseudomonadota bacterium]